jgi:hypothetical protein
MHARIVPTTKLVPFRQLIIVVSFEVAIVDPAVKIR